MVSICGFKSQNDQQVRTQLLLQNLSNRARLFGYYSSGTSEFELSQIILCPLLHCYEKVNAI